MLNILSVLSGEKVDVKNRHVKAKYICDSTSLSCMFDISEFELSEFDMTYCFFGWFCCSVVEPNPNKAPPEVHIDLATAHQLFASFNHIINHTGVYWDHDNNIVHASPDMWEHLKHHVPLAKAYMHQGDPLYDSLNLLFCSPTYEHDIEEIDQPAPEVDAPAPDVSSNFISPAPMRFPNTSKPVILNFYDEVSDGSIST